MNKKTRKLGARFMWVQHHIHKQPTQDIHPPSTTHTTHHQHHTPTPPKHRHHHPLPTTHHNTPPTKSTTQARQVRLARARPLRRPCAWLRPLAAFGQHQQQRQPARQQVSRSPVTASQPVSLATMGSCSTSAETRNTSASRQPSKQAPRPTRSPNTASAALTVNW